MEQQCRALKQVAAEMLACRKRGGPSEELQQLHTKTLLILALLKSSYRTLCEETEQVREATAQAKAQFDSAELSLQNLLYEKGHYLKEIRACQSFRSKYSEEDIGLMPLAEFLGSDPERAKLGVAADNAAAGDHGPAHALMLARLEAEGAQRTEALKKAEAARSRRDALAATVANKRAFLQALQDQLAAIRATAEPVRAKLGLPTARRPPIQARELAALPAPLHVAYMQLAAASEAFSIGAEVTIEDSSQDGADALMDSADGEAEGKPAEQVGEGREAGNGAEDGEEPELEPGEHRPTAKQRRPLVETLDEGQRAHPLSVHVRVPTEAAGRPVQLRLRWLPALHLVTACCGDPADDVALARLFNGDAGLAVPSEAAHLAAGGNLNWDPARPDRPYRWAQDLAGLDALPPLDAAGFVADAAAAEEIMAKLPALRMKAGAATVLERLRTLRSNGGQSGK